MTNLTEVRASLPSTAITGSEHEGGAVRRPETDRRTNWFVAPIVVPALLFLLIIVRVVYQAYS